MNQQFKALAVKTLETANKHTLVIYSKKGLSLFGKVGLGNWVFLSILAIGYYEQYIFPH